MHATRLVLLTVVLGVISSSAEEAEFAAPSAMFTAGTFVLVAPSPTGKAFRGASSRERDAKVVRMTDFEQIEGKVQKNFQSEAKKLKKARKIALAQSRTKASYRRRRYNYRRRRQNVCAKPKKGLACKAGKESFAPRDCNGNPSYVQACFKDRTKVFSDGGRQIRNYETKTTHPLCTECDAKSSLFVMTKGVTGGPSGMCVLTGGKGQKGSAHGTFTDPGIYVARCKPGKYPSKCQYGKFKWLARLSSNQYVRFSIANVKCNHKTASQQWFGNVGDDQPFAQLTPRDVWKRSRDCKKQKMTWRMLLWSYRSCSRKIKDKNGRRYRICVTKKTVASCMKAAGYKYNNRFSGYKIVNCNSEHQFQFLMAGA